MKKRRDENGYLTSCTIEQDKFIQENYLKLPPQQIADAIGGSETRIKCRMKQLGLIVPKKIIEQRIKDSRIKKGTTPPNKGKKWDDIMSKEAQANCRKTTFKKGNLPHNCYHEVGKIVVREREKESYNYICVELGNWQLLHVVNWEKVHGKIPIGHCLWCKDGNTLNSDIGNWELITRAENLARNNMSDSAIASKLARINTGKQGNFIDYKAKEEYLNHPELIELKRAQLLHQRALKEVKP